MQPTHPPERADAYLLALVRFTHCNPVRAGFVGDPGEYVWNSHRAYLGHGQPWSLSTEMTCALLGGRYGASRARPVNPQRAIEPPGWR
jgi:hypothetical protein